jgi:hypothetical protein
MRSFINSYYYDDKMRQLGWLDHVARMEGMRKETIEENVILYGELSLITKSGIIEISM